MTREKVTGPQPEIMPFDGVSNPALIVHYLESGTDPDIARALSLRLAVHADYQGDPTLEPLLDAQGKQIVHDVTQTPLTLADYVEYAAAHHPHGLRQILAFFYTEPGSPEYQAGQAVYQRYANPDPAQA